MRIDFWEKQRSEATGLSNGLKVRTDDENGRFNLEMWKPKATKPFANYFFRSAEAREKYIAEQVANYDAHLARKEQQKKDRVTGDPSLADPGAIFCYSWGWEQTNVYYYQVVKRSGLTVTLAEIGCESVAGSEGFMSDSVRPAPDAFLMQCRTCRHSEGATCHSDVPYAARERYGCTCEKYEPQRRLFKKRLIFSNGQPMLSLTHSIGSLVRAVRNGVVDSGALPSHYRSWYN